jgi:hypothetical protein
MKRTVAILEAMWRSSDQECARLEAEVERLVGIVAIRNDEAGKLHAEVERLKAENTAWHECALLISVRGMLITKLGGKLMSILQECGAERGQMPLRLIERFATGLIGLVQPTTLCQNRFER